MNANTFPEQHFQENGPYNHGDCVSSRKSNNSGTRKGSRGWKKFIAYTECLYNKNECFSGGLEKLLCCV